MNCLQSRRQFFTHGKNLLGGAALASLLGEAVAQAAGVDPRFQYSPPISTAPEPPTNMAPVMAKKSIMYWFCLNSKLKKNMNVATPTMAQRSILIC